MATNEFDTRLVEVSSRADEFRQQLVTKLIPADISSTAKVPFKLRILRELLLHRLSNLTDGALSLYKSGLTVPAFVLTRAALETMAMLFYVNKNVESALSDSDVEALDAIAMNGTFGSKDESTPYQAVNVLTLIAHVEKQFPGIQDDFQLLCEFSHPNCAGLMVAYERVEKVNIENPFVPVALGAVASDFNPQFGLNCLRIAIEMTDWIAHELAAKDDNILHMCEQNL